MEDPGEAKAKLTAFEAELRETQERMQGELMRLEGQIDQARDSGDKNPRELLEKLYKTALEQSYLKSMERDVERIRHKS